MKHLLIMLISILLLSSPLFGQETGVLYQYESSSGIQWKTFGNEKVQPKYEGEIKNGKMDGFGVLIYPYGGKSVVGEWKDGKEWNTKHRNKDGKLIWNFEMEKNGLVTITYPDGDKYVGEFKDGGKNGQGTFTWSDGKKYVGEYKEDLMNGQGTISWSNMEKFVGEWKDGKRWNGTYYDKEGNIHSKVVNGKGQKYYSLKPTPSSPVSNSH